MPSKPPMLRQRPSRSTAGWKRPTKSRQTRGYGRAHELMRELLMREVILCEECARRGRVTPGSVADHIKPLADGGTGDRDNYQLLCKPCDRVKLQADAERKRGKRP